MGDESPPPLDFCYEGDPDLLPIAVANQRIQTHIVPIVDTESVALRDGFERVLAKDVHSLIDVPGHVNSAVDGYALSNDDLPDAQPRELTVIGSTLAGEPFDGIVNRGECVRIMTGAVMPSGTDAVVMLEQVKIVGDRITITPGHKRGQNVRQAGEDIREGGIVLKRGVRLLPAELGLLASIGVAEIDVYRKLRVAFFSTGNELRSLGESLDRGCVYDSNRYTLFGMLRRLGVEIIDMGVVRDEPQAMKTAFNTAAHSADVVITSGGVSTGDADYVKATLEELGHVGFWRIAIRPGRPLAFGKVHDAMFFGLPGNPVAVMVTYYQLVQPALRRMMGERDPRPMPLVRAECTNRLRKKSGRVEYYRAVLERDGSGKLLVHSTGKTGSGLLHTMSDANCFIILPEDSESVDAGQQVDVQPFFGLV